MVSVNQLLMEEKGDGSDIKCYIVYHESDTDGRGSGGLMRYYAENYLMKNPIMIPHDHHKSIEWYDEIEPRDIILMGDIALPRENMIWLTQNTTFLWFDHHISAMNTVEDINIKGERNTEMSACGLIYENLLKPALNYIPEDTETIIQLISDYDNWNVAKYGDVEYKNTPCAFSVYMSSVNINPNTPDGYARWVEVIEEGIMDDMTVDEMLDKGRFLQAFQDKKNAGAVKNNAFEIEFEGLRGLACFGVHGSRAFDTRYDESKHDIMISINVQNNKEYSITLYTTKDDVDVSLIAKKHGGGGHKGASGFTAKSIDFTGNELQIHN